MAKDTMKRFNPHTVRASKHLQAKTDKEKAAMRRARGVKQRWAQDRETKTSDGPMIAVGYSPIREDYTPCKLRGRSGTRLDPKVRALIAARRDGRRAFFAELGVRV